MKSETYETMFGTLEDEDNEDRAYYQMAQVLHLYFLDNIVDNHKISEYQHARNLWANPPKYFRYKQEINKFKNSTDVKDV